MAGKLLLLEDLPHDADGIRGIFRGETETGITFEVHHVASQRRMQSGEMVKAMINAQARGRPLGGLYVSEKQLLLHVQGRHAVQIEKLPSKEYRYGRRIDRSLRQLVGQIMEDMGFDLIGHSPRP